MIPVEDVRRGHIVTLPHGLEVPVIRVERYDADYVIVYQLGGLEKTYRLLRAGELVPAHEDLSLPVEDSADDLAEHEAGRQTLLELYRRHGPMPDSELVERANERDADAGRTLTPVSTLMRRRRELERRAIIEASGSRYHPESGATEPIWMLRPTDEQLTVAREYQPEPDF